MSFLTEIENPTRRLSLARLLLDLDDYAHQVLVGRRPSTWEELARVRGGDTTPSGKSRRRISRGVEAARRAYYRWARLLTELGVRYEPQQPGDVLEEGTHPCGLNVVTVRALITLSVAVEVTDVLDAPRRKRGTTRRLPRPVPLECQAKSLASVGKEVACLAVK